MPPIDHELSISLVIWNGAKWLPDLLSSLLNQTYQDYFLMIIDNDSVDDSMQIVAKFLNDYPEVAGRSRVVKNKQNLGFARAHNQGIAWTSSPYIMLLNQDVMLAPDYLSGIMDVQRDRMEAASAGGKILRMSSGVAPEQKNIIDSLGLKINRAHCVSNWGEGEIDRGQYDFEKPVFGVAGTLPIYRREALNSVSIEHEVLDEDFVSYKEDVDLAWRLQLGGFSAWYTPEAVAYHSRGLAATDNFQLQIKKRREWKRELKIYSLVNHYAIWLKNDSLFSLLKDSPWVLWSEVKRFGYYLVFEPLTLIKAKVRFCKLFFVFYRKRKLLKNTHRVKPIDLRRWWV